MAKISLRAYTKEIDGLIDRGQYDQALAHCRFILKFFPKHIDTYRLMAKAYLESQRFGDASDVFQRVLSSIPDDFVSHLGMSIIREDEGNLDAAIWHMERAFEVQPANAAIQSEMQRLYGRRDGMEPPKVRLTRGALARMYYKGELYQQAISELRASLAADPQRPDLQLLLAQSYARSGQKIEAANACTALLKKLPYCIEANRILAEILANTDRADDAQTYRTRAISLNPYLGQTSPKAPTADLVPDEAVVVEKLEWTPEKGVVAQPQWAESLGVSLASQAEDQAARPDIPDWLKELETGAAHRSAEDSESLDKVSPFISSDDDQAITAGSSTDATANEDELIPDWMKEAGWMPSSSDSPEAEMGYTFGEEQEETDSNELAPAEIPSWLKAIAPPQIAEDDRLQPDELEDVDPKLVEALDSAALPWLDETPPGPSDTITTWLGEKEQPSEPDAESGSSIDLPDWLVGAAAAGAVAAVMKPDSEAPAEEPPPAQQTEVSAEFGDEFQLDAELSQNADVPDWLLELAEEGQPPSQSVTEAPAADEGLPDWMAGAALGAAAAVDMQDDSPELQADVSQQAEMKPEGEALTGEDFAPAGESSEGEIPDWLQELGEPLPGDEAEAAEQADWMTDLEEISPVAEGGEPVEWMESVPESEAALPASSDELPVWLSELAPAEASQETQGEQAEEAGSDLPGWLVGAAAGAAAGAGALFAAEDETGEEGEPLLPEDAELEVPEELGDAVQEEPSVPQPGESAVAGVSQEEEDAAFAWLESLAAKQGASEALLLNPEDRLEEPPEWVQEAAMLAAATASVSAAESRAEEDAEEAGELPHEQAEGEIEAEGLQPAEAESLESMPDSIMEEQGPPAAAEAEQVGVELSEASASAPEQLEPLDIEPAEYLPEWLRTAGSESAVAQAEEETSQDSEITAWLSEMDQPEAEGAVQADESGLEELEAGQPGVELDWLTELEASDQFDELDYKDAALSDWLSELPEEDILAETAEPAMEADESAEPEGIPDWVVGAAAYAAAAEVVDALQGQEKEVEYTPSDQVDAETGIPDWLEEPEPDLEQTLVGASADQLQIEEPPVAQGDTQPSIAAGAAGEAADQELAEEAQLPGAEAGMEAAPEAAAEIADAQSEEDAAFAWLEGLAVRQGASEALLLSPEERLEEPPEWVKEASLEAEAEAPVEGLSEAEVSGESEQDLEQVETRAEQPQQEGPEPDELPEWLVGAAAGAAVAAGAMLAGHDEAQEAELETEEKVPESTPEEQPAPGDKLALEPVSDEEQPSAAPESDIDAAYAWLESLAVQQGAEEALVLKAEDRLEEPPEWVKQDAQEAALESQEQAAQLEETPQEGEMAEPEMSDEAGVEDESKIEEEMPELPAWLADVDIESGELVAESIWTPEMAEVSATEVEFTEGDQQPLDLNLASLIEIERLPGVGFRRAQALVEYRESQGALNSLDDLSAIEGFDTELVESLSGLIQVSGAGESEADLLEEVDADPLIQARAAIYRSDIPAALQSYQALIQDRERLPDIVTDLEEALYRFPLDVPLWMTLGDAQMRAGMVREALVSYNKAEELLH